MDIIQKIKNCYDYRTLFKIKPELNACGLTIESLNSGQHILCRIENGKPKADEVFIDFIYLEKRSLLEDINDVKKGTIIDFVERNISDNSLSDHTPDYINQNSLYGKAFGV